MNLPNKLTILRVSLVPVLIFTLLSSFSFNFLLSTLIFLIACITDHFDGFLARKKCEITNFGRFLDPLADKILSLSILLCFVQLGIISCISVIVILIREFLVSSLRFMAAKKNEVISANFLGKIKTVFGFMFISVTLVLKHFNIRNALLFEIGALIVALLTVITGIRYAIDNKEFLNFKD